MWKVSHKLKKQCHPGGPGLKSEMYYPQYDENVKFERLGVSFCILPGTDELSRSKMIVLVTRNISIYTNKVSGESAQGRGRHSGLTSGKPLSQRAWTFTKLAKYGKGKIGQQGSRNTESQPYECTTPGVLEVNKGMTMHVEINQAQTQWILRGVLSNEAQLPR